MQQGGNDEQKMHFLRISLISKVVEDYFFGEMLLPFFSCSPSATIGI
jgi:hypothetical protein